MYVSKRVIVLVILAAALVWPLTPGHTTSYAIGYGQHTEGPTKVLALPDGSSRVLGPLTASFSFGLDHAMCAVGEAGGELAPFNMLVYAMEITSATFSGDGRAVTLAGTARSITMAGGIILEDMLTAFTATGRDGGVGRDGDYFHISINTSLWPHTTFGKDLDGNPLPIFAGDVAVWTPLS